MFAAAYRLMFSVKRCEASTNARGAWPALQLTPAVSWPAPGRKLAAAAKAAAPAAVR